MTAGNRAAWIVFEKFVTREDERMIMSVTWCQVSVQKLERECRIFKQQRLLKKYGAIAQYKLPCMAWCGHLTRCFFLT